MSILCSPRRAGKAVGSALRAVRAQAPRARHSCAAAGTSLALLCPPYDVYEEANAAPPGCFVRRGHRRSLFPFPKREWSAGRRLRVCETPWGLILGLRVPPPGRSRAPRRDGIASSVPRRALGNPVRVRTGRKGEEAPPGAPPAARIAPLRPPGRWPDLRPASRPARRSARLMRAARAVGKGS